MSRPRCCKDLAGSGRAVDLATLQVGDRVVPARCNASIAYGIFNSDLMPAVIGEPGRVQYVSQASVQVWSEGTQYGWYWHVDDLDYAP